MRLAIAGALVALLLAAAGLLLHSKTAVIAELVADVSRGDAAAIRNRIDFPSLRDFVKADITANKLGAGQLGAGVGPEVSQVGAIVDYFLQPENVEVALYQRESLFRDVPSEAFIDNTGYAPLFGFQMTLGWPKTVQPIEDIPPALRERLKVRLTFRLEGTTWRITEMHVPLFMVPHQAYGAPATQLFGRPPKLP